MTSVDKGPVSLPIEPSASIDPRRTVCGERHPGHRHGAAGGSGSRGGTRLGSEAAYRAQPETAAEAGMAEAAADTMAGWEPWEGPEAGAVIENERAEVLDKVRRLAAEPNSSAFKAALCDALERKPPTRAAG